MKTVLTNVRVFDGHALSEPRTVVIDGETIGTDPSGGEVVDGGGQVLLPGLIECHVHLTGRDNLTTLAAYGVTTALEMASTDEAALPTLRGQTGVTDIRSAGLPAIGPGGPHIHIHGLAPDAIVLTPEQAAGFVAQRAANGSDYFKIVVEAPGAGGPDEATLKALVSAAHEHGLKVVAHGVTPGAYTAALDAGADILTHVPVIGVIDPADLDRIGPVIPTLTMMRAATDGRGVPFDAAHQNAATLYRAGKVIMAGTDANNAGGVPYHVDYGDSLHTELELLVDIGMSPAEALRAATSVPAEVFGLTDRGAVEPGLRADLVLIDGDPLADIRATRAITRVWCAGVEVQRG